MKVLTEADLRAAGLSGTKSEYHIPEGAYVTEPAREYLRDRGIRLITDNNSYEKMSRQKTEQKNPCPYRDARTGEIYSEKPEEMTHLRGNLLVAKTDPRIALRGGLDFLQAEVILMQARYGDNSQFKEDLNGVLRLLRAVLGAEVKGEICEELELFGLGQEEIRKLSHHVKENFGMDHPIPDCSMGETALTLNLLRTKVRQVELLAARAFPEGDELRIIRSLNRLSSGVYILFCRCLAGYYGSKPSGPACTPEKGKG